MLVRRAIALIIGAGIAPVIVMMRPSRSCTTVNCMAIQLVMVMVMVIYSALVQLV